MKHNHIIKFITIIIAILLMPFSPMAQTTQKITESKLLGCWKLSRFEFLKPVKDSVALVNASKNYVSCFEVNGKFSTTQKTGNIEKKIGTGTYRIAKDGKTIYQKRDMDDENIDSPAEILILTDQELAIKADNVIIHLVRVPNSN